MSVKDFTKKMISELKSWVYVSVLTIACLVVTVMIAILLVANGEWGYFIGTLFLASVFVFQLYSFVTQIVGIFKRYNRDFLVIKTRD